MYLNVCVHTHIICIYTYTEFVMSRRFDTEISELRWISWLNTELLKLFNLCFVFYRCFMYHYVSWKVRLFVSYATHIFHGKFGLLSIDPTSHETYETICHMRQSVYETISVIWDNRPNFPWNTRSFVSVYRLIWDILSHIHIVSYDIVSQTLSRSIVSYATHIHTFSLFFHIQLIYKNLSALSLTISNLCFMCYSVFHIQLCSLWNFLVV